MANHQDITYLLNFFAASYGNSVNVLRLCEQALKVAASIPPEESDDDLDLPEFLAHLQARVNDNSAIATASLATLVEIKQSMSQEEWWGYLDANRGALGPLDQDMARYEALLAFDKAGLPMPTEEDPGVFVFGEFNEPPVPSTTEEN